MRKRKLLGKALSVLLSGAMLVGAIPAVASAEDYDLPLLEAETDTAGIEGHTRDGYFSTWSEDFEGGSIPSDWGNFDLDDDGEKWNVSDNTGDGMNPHHGDYCAFSESLCDENRLEHENL